MSWMEILMSQDHPPSNMIMSILDVIQFFNVLVLFLVLVLMLLIPYYVLNF